MKFVGKIRNRKEGIISYSATISVVDEVTPKLHRLGAMTPAGRKILHTGIAGTVTGLVRNYLRNWNRHDAAAKVGGTPTQFMRRAADATNYEATKDAAITVINSPGFGRADHDVDIYPTGGHHYLTLPIAGEAYGHRIREFPGGKFIRGKGSKGTASLLYGMMDGKQFHPLYALVTEVHQKQDETLLPAKEDIIKAAMRGAAAGMDEIMEQSTTSTTSTTSTE